MFDKDTPQPGAANKTLSHIVIKWTIDPAKPYESHVLYDAKELGERRCILRAEARAFIIQNNERQFRMTSYYSDGSSETVEAVTMPI
jgi:hypothetical protein